MSKVDVRPRCRDRLIRDLRTWAGNDDSGECGDADSLVLAQLRELGVGLASVTERD